LPLEGWIAHPVGGESPFRGKSLPNVMRVGMIIVQRANEAAADRFNLSAGDSNAVISGRRRGAPFVLDAMQETRFNLVGLGC